MSLRCNPIHRSEPVSSQFCRSSNTASLQNISVILFIVGKFLLPLFFFFAVASCLLSPPRAAAQQAPAPQQVPAQQQPPAQPQFPPPQSAAPTPTPSSPIPPGPVIVLDPAHGGTDTGARGENGLAEKDVVLQIARTLRAQFEEHGYRVVMTRNDDSNPSYDDRAAIANAYGDAVFVTLHVGSTGKMGTVRAYYDRFWSSIPQSSLSAAPSANSGPIIASPPANTLISWQQAQRPYVDASRRLADLLQLQFTELFPGSPLAASGVALRDLRSVANPAVAIEISNVSAPSVDALLALAGPLSVAIERAIQTFRQSAAPGAP
jgi:N-acetylmuramoyl-L-alanine amidase